MIGGGAQFQVSGLGHQVPDSGAQVRVQVQEIGHLSSAIDSVIFQFQVAGGSSRCRVAGNLSSALCHRSSHLSSAQPSILPSIRPLLAIIQIVTEM